MASAMCYIHPDRTANANCEKCHRAICAEDHRTIVEKKKDYAEKKLICSNCKASIDRRNNIIRAVVVVIFGISAIQYAISNYL